MEGRKTRVLTVWRAFSAPLLVVGASLLAGCAFLEEGLGDSIITGGSMPAYEGNSIASNNHPVQEGGGMVDIQGPPLEDALGDLPETPASEVAPRSDYPDARTAQVQREETAYDRRSRERWMNRGNDSKDAGAYQPEYNASIGGELAAYKIGLPNYNYLGLESGGIRNLSAGYNLDDEDTTISTGIEGTFRMGTYYGRTWRFMGGFRDTKVEVSGPRGGFDPGAGNFLLIPGTGDGPNGAGFALAPGVPGQNAVTFSDYSLDYSQTSFYGKFSTDFWCDDDEDEGGLFHGIGFTPYAGVTYAYSSFTQRFGGGIPGFGVDFQYDTRLRNNAWGLMFGGQVMKPVRNTPVMLRAGLTGQVDFNRVRGSDSLDFTGFGSQTMQVSNNDTTFSYTANAGVTVGARAPIRFDIDFFGGGIGNTPVVTRDGVGPSRVELERSDYFGGMLRTTFTF